MEAMQIAAGPSFPEEPTTMGMAEGDRSLPPKKRAGLTAPEGALEVPKKAKVETNNADSDAIWSRDWLTVWNEFMAKENTENKPLWGGDEEWLPEGVHWYLYTRRGDDYQNLAIWDYQNLYKDKYEGCEYKLENEEQRAYLKFYHQLCKEVKLGADCDECQKKAWELAGDLDRSLVHLAIDDRIIDLDAELLLNELNHAYCYLWDEVVLEKRVYASVAAEIKEKYPMHLQDIMENASGNCKAKYFLKELEDRIDASMPNKEVHEQIKKVCVEEWSLKYVTFASYLELKMMVAEKLGMLPKELQGLLQELHGGAEN